MPDGPTEQDQQAQQQAEQEKAERQRVLAQDEAQQAARAQTQAARASGPEPPPDWEPPSEGETNAMNAAGFGLINGCFRPRSRIAIVI